MNYLKSLVMRVFQNKKKKNFIMTITARDIALGKFL